MKQCNMYYHLMKITHQLSNWDRHRKRNIYICIYISCIHIYNEANRKAGFTPRDRKISYILRKTILYSFWKTVQYRLHWTVLNRCSGANESANCQKIGKRQWMTLKLFTIVYIVDDIQTFVCFTVQYKIYTGLKKSYSGHGLRPFQYNFS